MVIFQDVTDVVEMEQDLRRSERLAAIGQLSASIAHEIRNPLAAISGSIQILQKDIRRLDPGDQACKLMDIVLRETDRLNHLITDFLHYARPGPLNPQPVVVGAAVDEVLELFESARPPGVAVHTDLEPGAGVLADPSKLRQVLWNLILNASEAMPEGGRLEVAARTGTPQEGPAERRNATQEDGKADWTEIVVGDEGVGIAPEALEQIFEPFFTTKRGGSGLGLAAVHRIIEDHGGSVRLESTLGRGTRVKLRLPRAETA